MEINHRILHFNNCREYDILKRELDKLGFKYTTRILGSFGGKESRSIEYNILESIPAYPLIAALIEKYSFFSQTGVAFEEKDYGEAEWFSVNSSESQYPAGDDYIDETYDTANYCKRCGIGAAQNRPFRLQRDFTHKKDLFFGLHWVYDELFIRPSVVKILSKQRISGWEVSHPIYHKSEKKMPLVHQLVIKNVLKPGLIKDGLTTETCSKDNDSRTPDSIRRMRRYGDDYPFCGRMKYHYPARDFIQFHRNIFMNAPDVVKSEEYFGSGGQAFKLILVSHKFYEIAQSLKLRCLLFKPVKLI